MLGGREVFFKDCSNEPSRYGREGVSKDFKWCLANVLFDRFVPASAQDQYSFSLVEVLERIREDTKSTFVMLQVDEYSKNPILARALIRACRETFCFGPNTKNGLKPGVLVIPMLSGILFAELRSSLIGTSHRTVRHFFSLTGITDAENLGSFEKSFFKAVGIPEVNMQLLLSWFRGFPRLYSWCLQVIKDQPSVLVKLKELKNKVLDYDTTSFFYDGVLTKYKDLYSMQLWVDAFCNTKEILNKLRRSDPSRFCAFEHLKRIHTFAVTGDSILIQDCVCRGM